MVSDEIAPICLFKRQTKYPIELATVTGSSTSNRQIATIKLDNSRKLEAIIVKNLQIDNYSMPLLESWKVYQNEWSDQIRDNNHITAQILIGSDQAILHPIDALDQCGLPIETEHTRLKRSKLTDKYLAHGHNNPTLHYSSNAKDVTNTVNYNSNEKDISLTKHSNSNEKD